MATTAQQQTITLAQERYPDSELNQIHDLQIFIYQDRMGRPSCMIWFGRQQNPAHNYYFRSLDNRKKHIDNVIQNAHLRLKDKEERKAKRKAFVPEIDIGDIYVASWGYEQTNVDFYQVVGKKSKHYAYLRKIGQTEVAGSSKGYHDACHVMADKDNFLSDDVLAKRITQCRYSQCIRIDSVRSAFKWDGKAKYKSWGY